MTSKNIDLRCERRSGEMADVPPDQDLDDALDDEASLLGDPAPSEAGSAAPMEEEDVVDPAAEREKRIALERARVQQLERARLAELNDERRRREIEVERERERQLGGTSGVSRGRAGGAGGPGGPSDSDDDSSEDDQGADGTSDDEGRRLWRKYHPDKSGKGRRRDDDDDDDSSVGGPALGHDDDSADNSSMRGGERPTRSAARPNLFSGQQAQREAMEKRLCNDDVLAPVFPHHKESNGGWLEFSEIFSEPPNDAHAAAAAMAGDDEERTMRPARTMVFNMPKSMFRPDADRLRDMVRIARPTHLRISIASPPVCLSRRSAPTCTTSRARRT